MAYAWGEDGCLAVTNHNGYIAVLSRTESENEPYEVIYKGKVSGDFDKSFFDTEMVFKKNSHAKYKYCIDSGLAASSKDGQVALVQNLLVGDPELNIRNAALECAVIDKSGIIYRGRLKSNIVDLDYNISAGELRAIRDISGDATAEQIIEPVRNENRCEWITAGR